MLGLSNLLVKLSKQVVNASIIFITSITPESPSWPLDCSTAQVHFSFLGPIDLWALEFFNACNLWQLGLVWPWFPQWWQKCWVLGPLCDFGSDFPFPLGLTTDCLGGLVIYKPLVSHIILLLWLTFLAFLAATIGSLALIGVSQIAFVRERFLLRKDIIKLLGGDSLYLGIYLNHFKLKEFHLCVCFS